MSSIVFIGAGLLFVCVYGMTFLHVPFRAGPTMKWWERALLSLANALPFVALGFILRWFGW